MIDLDWIRLRQNDVLHKIMEYLDDSLSKNLELYNEERDIAIKVREQKIQELEDNGLSALQSEEAQQYIEQKFGNKNDDLNSFMKLLDVSNGMLEKNIDAYFKVAINTEDEKQLRILQLDFLKKAKVARDCSPYLDRTIKIQEEHAKTRNDFKVGYCHGLSLLWAYGVHITQEVEKAVELNMEFAESAEDMDEAELIRKTEEITSEINTLHSAAIRVQSQVRGVIERKKTRKIEREYGEAKGVFFKQLKSLKFSQEEPKRSIFEDIYKEVFNVDGTLKPNINFKKIQGIMLILEKDESIGSEKGLSRKILTSWRDIRNVLKLLEIKKNDKGKRRKLSEKSKDVLLIKRLKQQRLLLQNEITDRRIGYEFRGGMSKEEKHKSLDEITKKRMKYEGLDNNAWFTHCIEHMLQWSPGSNKQDNMFESFINNIQYLQRSNLPSEVKIMELEPGGACEEIKQSDIEIFMSSADTSERQFGISSTYLTNNIDDVQKFLVKPQNRCKMIYFGIKEHGLSAYCDETGNVTIFDPNIGSVDFNTFKTKLMTEWYKGRGFYYCAIVEPGFTGNPSEEIKIDFAESGRVEDKKELFDCIVTMIPSMNLSDDLLYKFIMDYYDKNSDLFQLSNANGLSVIGALALQGNYKVLNRLLESSLNVRQKILTSLNQEDGLGRTPVHYAANNGQTKLLEMLLNKKYISQSMLKLKDQNGRSPIHYAAQNGHARLFEMFLNREDVRNDVLNLYDNNGRTPVHLLSALGHKSLLDMLLDRDDIEQDVLNIKDRDGKTSVHYLVGNGQEKLFQDLLNREILSQNMLIQKDGMGRTPMHYAAQNNQTILFESVANQKIIENGLLQYKDTTGQTMAHKAAEAGHLEFMKMLIDKGGVEMLSEADNVGKTPLQYAAEKGHTNLLKVLLDKGFLDQDMLKKKDESGKTLIHYAAEYGDVDLLQKLIDSVGVNILKDKDGIGKTPIQYAAENEDASAMMMLLNRDDITSDILIQRDKECKTPMHYAVKFGDVHLLNKLVDKAGIDMLDEKDVEGKTPIHYAGEYNRGRFIERLLDRPDAKEKTLLLLQDQDVYGKTPLHYSAIAGYSYLFTMLNKVEGLSKDIFEKKDGSDKMPMHYLVTNNHKTAFLNFMKVCPKDILKEEDKTGKTILSYIAEHGDITFFNILWRQDDIGKDILKQKDGTGKSPIHYVIENGYGDLLGELIDKAGIEILNQEDITGKTPIHYAAELAKTELLDKMIEKVGQDILIQRDETGKTPIHYAVQSGNTGLIEMLIQKSGVGILQYEDKLGDTPVHLAAKAGKIGLMEVLIRNAGIGVLQYKNKSGETPGDLAAKAGHIKLIEEIKKAYDGLPGNDFEDSEQKTVLSHDEPKDGEIDIANKSALSMQMLHRMRAAKVERDGRRKEKGELEKRISDINEAIVLAEDGDVSMLSNILSLASYKNKQELIRSKNENGKTFAHIAAENGCSEFLRDILGSASDELKQEILTEKNYDSDTIVNIAKGQGHVQVVKLIEDEIEMLARETAAKKIQNRFRVKVDLHNEKDKYRFFKHGKEDKVDERKEKRKENELYNKGKKKPK